MVLVLANVEVCDDRTDISLWSEVGRSKEYIMRLEIVVSNGVAVKTIQTPDTILHKSGPKLFSRNLASQSYCD